jgi:hypothetical protein
MDNEGAFRADESVDDLHRRAPARDRTGKGTMAAALGGIDMEPSVAHHERAPLLGLSSNANGQGDDGDDEAPEPAWFDEYNQWDHLPWYRRPSVNGLLKIFART